VAQAHTSVVTYVSSVWRSPFCSAGGPSVEWSVGDRSEETSAHAQLELATHLPAYRGWKWNNCCRINTTWHSRLPSSTPLDESRHTTIITFQRAFYKLSIKAALLGLDWLKVAPRRLSLPPATAIVSHGISQSSRTRAVSPPETFVSTLPAFHITTGRAIIIPANLQQHHHPRILSHRPRSLRPSCRCKPFRTTTTSAAKTVPAPGLLQQRAQTATTDEAPEDPMAQ
jgi:hypothetical protein